MAKVTFTKLGLKPNTEIKTINWNDQVIEVKQYLPMAEVLQLITEILNDTIDDNYYYNTCKLHIYTTIEIILAYTNITVTDKQKKDILKLFDLFASGLGELILNAIPQEQIDFICENSLNILDAIYKHKSSALGIVEAITTDYSALSLDASALQSQIADPNNLALLKDVLAKLG